MSSDLGVSRPLGGAPLEDALAVIDLAVDGDGGIPFRQAWAQLTPLASPAIADDTSGATFSPPQPLTPPPTRTEDPRGGEEG